MINDPMIEIQRPPSGQANGCLSMILLLVTAVWVSLILFFFQAFIWGIEQTQFSSSLAHTDWRWLVSLFGGLAMWVPLALLARFGPKSQQHIYRSWRMAAGAVLVMVPTRLLTITDSQGVAVLQIIALLVFVSGELLLSTRNRDSLHLCQAASWPRGLFVAAGLGALMCMPWAALGALGSALDLLLGVFTSILCGTAAAVLLQAGIFAETKPGFWAQFIGVPLALAILSSGLGLNGNEWVILLVLPSMGWLAAAFWRWSKESPAAWPAAALALAIGISGPLIWVDPDELLAPISGTGDIASYAVAVQILVALVVIVLVGFAWRWLPEAGPFTAGLALLAGLAWLWLGGIYMIGGRPGFYGEQLFVIMKSQADLSGPAKIADYPNRREVVYQTMVEQAKQSQTGIRQDLQNLGLQHHAYYLVNALEVDGGPIVRAWLLTRADVDRILDSPHLRPLSEYPALVQGTITKAPESPQWNLTMIRANLVWDELKITGEGVVVGQSDSGVDGQHPEVADQYRGNSAGNDYNWFDPWFHSTTPVDQDGHGTHTLGTILGKSVGVAPNASWIGCVNLALNLGNPAVYLDCMQFMLAPFPQQGDPFRDGKPELGANILNNSWGCPVVEGCDAEIYLAAVRALQTAGVFVVASAGNEGENGCSTVADPLAIYDEVYTVGALDSQRNRANFSNLGPVVVDGSNRIKPDLMAPGAGVLSSYPKGTYSSLSGTSMAGPHVVGTVALMWSANPKLIGNIKHTREILDWSAQPFLGKNEGCGSSGVPNNTSGYGIVDAYKAVKMALDER